MEFLLGFVLGAGCVVFLLLQWGKHHPSSAQSNTSTKNEQPLYDNMVADLEADSDQFLRELQGILSSYSRKRR
jgi:hypothetical protein